MEWRTRYLSGFVVKASLKDKYVVAVDTVHYSVFRRDASRPAPPKLVLECFRLAAARKWRALHFSEQLI